MPSPTLDVIAIGNAIVDVVPPSDAARHPERLGVGGAVRPDDGLKGPPSPPLMPGGVMVIPGSK